ncbi:uncharacterized protein LOC115452175 isoform X2 [Manduca sexta]|nr:uncharacterized protein LOC115452175 isoform X2 [Manduca sexta]XP_030036501.2 uncharacterized protein LOC115452175 isoform X2 [Manduca sexta]
MNILWCCLVAVLLKTSECAVDVEKTVQQVQSILKANLQLPRLTRDEIIQLMNDIKAEDAKSSTSRQSTEDSGEAKTTTTLNTVENEINPITQTPNSLENIPEIDKDVEVTSIPPSSVEHTTRKAGSTLMVVLPYTPRDGSSLQELYTRPPRVEVVPVAVTPQPVKTLKSNTLLDTLTDNARLAYQKKDNFPAELQAFLDAHGLKGTPGQDHFLLPLEGFKPLPPATIVDGNVQLPENILLTYDLISPDALKASNEKLQSLSPNNFLYEPLRPELPFELETASSEIKETSYPYDMPKTRKPKSTDTASYEPIDYDSVKVIPLNKGINPLEDLRAIVENEQIKRQANSTNSTSENSTTTEEPKNAVTDAPDSVPADTDSGASISDLEDSFGGAAPSKPGDSELPPPRKNGFYWMLDWNSFLEVGDGDTKVNIRFEPKLGDPQMFLPVTVP